jgi:hypothetical protein
MNMNINQLVERLKDVPDNALFGYVQDPKLQVPSVLALAEISRRQQIRAAAPQPQMQGPQPTVADQVISANQGIGALPQAQQMPQAPMQMAQAPQMVDQGMASLPLPDTMYGEQSMAAGGIVAFDEGGEVPSYKLGGLTEDDIAYQQALQGVELPSWARTGLDYTALLPYTLGKKGIGYLKGRQPVFDPEQGKYVLQRDFGKEQDRRTKTKEFLEKEAEAQLSDPAYRAGVNKIASERDNALAMAANKGIPTEGQGLKTLANTQRGGANTTANADTGSDRGQPSRNARGELVFNPVTVDDDGYGELMPDQRGMRDYAAEYKAELGDDPNRAAMQERLDRMEARTAKEEERAPAMALVEAGLGIIEGAQPRPGEAAPSLFTALGRGGVQGLKSLAAAKERVNNAREKQFEIADRMAQAQRAVQLAALNYGAESKRADDQTRRAVGLAKQADKARAAEFNAKGEYDAIKDKLTFQLENAKINQMAQYYNRPPAEIQLIDKLAKESGISFGEAFEKIQGLKRSGSSGIDEDTIVRAYAKDRADGTIEPSVSYAAYKAQFTGGVLTGGGTLVKDKSGKMVYQPQSN